MASKSKTKIYFWLKLDENFFKNIIIKKARKAGGDTMVIIYQRLMLESLSTDGILYYEGALDNLSEELSLSLDEDVEKIQMTLAFFTKYGLIQIDDNQNADMLQVHALVEQETNWARYQRVNRKKKEAKKLDNVQPVSNQCPTEIELEKELKIDIDIENREKEPSSLLAEFINLFINFSSKNLSKKAITQVEFLKLPSFQQEQAVIGAKNYIEWYKNENPEDTKGQYSVNSANFLSNMMFMDYQETPKTVQGTLGGMI
ncbi:phage replisome organizer protein [Lactococcus formosensis]|uniref:phage replisome organizer protein n=1 Tax=Lactococcus formosensis TaxID=1281486 RepID=UPI0032638BCA